MAIKKQFCFEKKKNHPGYLKILYVHIPCEALMREARVGGLGSPSRTQGTAHPGGGEDRAPIHTPHTHLTHTHGIKEHKQPLHCSKRTWALLPESSQLLEVQKSAHQQVWGPGNSHPPTPTGSQVTRGAVSAQSGLVWHTARWQ